MAQDRTIHTKQLGEKQYRDLDVYYEKGGTNYWNHNQKPKGIYFSTSKYERSDGFKTYSIRPNKHGEGYTLITPLERYSRKQLSLLQNRVRDNVNMIHAMLDAGDVSNLILLLTGKLSETALRGLAHAYAPNPAPTQAAA